MSAQALEAIYRGTAEASKYGWTLACGFKCGEVADNVFLVVDYAVDRSLAGKDVAAKNLAVRAMTSALLQMDGVAPWIQNRATQFVGGSGLSLFSSASRRGCGPMREDLRPPRMRGMGGRSGGCPGELGGAEAFDSAQDKPCGQSAE